MSSEKKGIFLKAPKKLNLNDSFKNKLEKMYHNVSSSITKKNKPKNTIYSGNSNTIVNKSGNTSKPAIKSSPEKIETPIVNPFLELSKNVLPNNPNTSNSENIDTNKDKENKLDQYTKLSTNNLNNKVIEVLVTKVFDIQKQEFEFKNEFIKQQIQLLVEKNQFLEKNIHNIQEKQIEYLYLQIDKYSDRYSFIKTEFFLGIVCLLPLLLKFLF